MKRMKRNKGSKLRLSAGRKERRHRSFYIELVGDGTQMATGDSEHALQDELHSGPSRINPELHRVSQVQLQTPSGQAISSLSLSSGQVIPSSSLLKTWVRSQQRCENGTFGQRCTVKTNYFVVSLPELELHKYDVSIYPENTSCDVNRAVMGKLISVHRQSDLNGCLPAYDGRKNLYTAAPLPFIRRTFEIMLQSDGQAQRSPMELGQYQVVITFVAHVGLQHLGMNLTVEEDEHQVALQALDTILQEILIIRSCPIAKSLQLGEGLEIQLGFYKALQLAQRGMLLNIGCALHLDVLMKPIPVIDYIALLLGRNTLDGPLCDGDLTKIKKALEGVMVQVTLTGNMCKCHRVLGLTDRVIRELPPEFGDHGAKKTFVHYFKEEYGYNIEQTDLPCLQVGRMQTPILLPMEVCKIADGQRYSKQLNQKQISTLLEAARLHPLERKRCILQTVDGNGNDESYAKEFGIEIRKELLSLDACVLPPPLLKFHNTGMTKEFLPRVGKWNMIRKRMFDGGKVSNWTCVNFCDVEDEIVRSFCHELAVVCKASGMDFSPDPVLPLVTANPMDLELTLKSCHKAMHKLKPKGRELDLLIVILPNNKSSLYGNLKRICETELGLVSQCFLAKHVSKMSKQYLANVALKINVKVGGKNTVLSDAVTRRLPCVGDKPTIIFGAHVMHPGKSNSPSIAAVVASQGWPEVANYAALACAQANGQELISDLFEVPHVCETGAVAGGMINEHLISFRRRTGLKPGRIIYYRDAVSDRQLYKVMWQELVAIKKACSYLEPNYYPSVTYVVLQKRRHTRFFPDNVDDQSSDSSGNVLPGTVVDSAIRHPNEFGFYLCSQIGTKGMVQPVHYHILWDENRFTADTFQCLTNYLCYTYARCTHSVSIVPPVYYAHLMASRGRLYMESMTSGMGDEGHAPSPSEESSSGPLRSVVATCLPAVKDNVKRGMFYC